MVEEFKIFFYSGISMNLSEEVFSDANLEIFAEISNFSGEDQKYGFNQLAMIVLHHLTSLLTAQLL